MKQEISPEDEFKLVMGLLVRDRYFIARYGTDGTIGRTPTGILEAIVDSFPWAGKIDTLSPISVRNQVCQGSFLAAHGLVRKKDGSLEMPHGGERKVNLYTPDTFILTAEDPVLFGYHTLLRIRERNRLSKVLGFGRSENHEAPYMRAKIVLSLEKAISHDEKIHVSDILEGDSSNISHIIRHLHQLKEAKLVKGDFTLVSPKRGAVFSYTINKNPKYVPMKGSDRIVYESISNLMERNNRTYTAREIQDEIGDTVAESTVRAAIVRLGNVKALKRKAHNSFSRIYPQKEVSMIVNNLFGPLYAACHGDPSGTSVVSSYADQFRENERVLSAHLKKIVTYAHSFK